MSHVLIEGVSVLLPMGNESGRYRISEHVSRLGLAGAYRVCLYSRRSGILIAETVSNTDGAYTFDCIAYKLGGYFVVAFDDTGQPVNAAIADYITPEPMP